MDHYGRLVLWHDSRGRPFAALRPDGERSARRTPRLAPFPAQKEGTRSAASRPGPDSSGQLDCGVAYTLAPGSRRCHRQRPKTSSKAGEAAAVSRREREQQDVPDDELDEQAAIEAARLEQQREPADLLNAA